MVIRAATTVFLWAIAFVLRWEGGYVDHPDDPGGRTKFGISQRAYPNENIAALTKERAIYLYRRDYWQRLDLDRLPAMVALVVMDTAVNMGKRRAVQILQMAYNELPGGGHLAVDGRLGPLTRRAINTWCGLDPERALVMAQRIIARRTKRYTRLAARARYAGFYDGWINRVDALGSTLFRYFVAQIKGPAALAA